jgi:hypothetical protein
LQPQPAPFVPFGRIALYPTEDCGVIGGDAAFPQEFFESR